MEIAGPNKTLHAFGVTLDTLNVHTTDSEGNSKFIDPTKNEYRGTMYKKLNLSKFAIYWNDLDHSFCPNSNITIFSSQGVPPTPDFSSLDPN